MYLGIDMGTSSIKSVLMDEDQRLLASHSAALDTSRLHDAWSEQDPQSWLDGIGTTLAALQASHPGEMQAVRGIGLSGHQHGATLLDAADQVLRPCILWNDTRSHVEAARMDTRRSRDLIGSILFPGFTSPKIAWVARHEPELFGKLARVLLPKDYARLWLTGEAVAEMSDASGTGWLDVAQRAWADELLEVVELNRSHMPRLVEGTEVSGQLRPELATRFGLPAGVVVAGGAGDNCAAACGMGTVTPGAAFASLGTSGVLFASNERFRPNAASAVHAFCHALPGTWHQMGVILAATDSLNWLGQVTGQSPADLSDAVEMQEPEPSAISFLPYLGGERTPHNDALARGAFVGLGHASGPAELTRAVMQGVSFAFCDSLDALAASGTQLERAYAVGGGARSAHWLRLMASALNMPLDTTVDGDYGAGFGAARLGMIAAEKADPLSVCTPPAVARTFEPDAALHERLLEPLALYRENYQALRAVREGHATSA